MIYVIKIFILILFLTYNTLYFSISIIERLNKIFNEFSSCLKEVHALKITTVETHFKRLFSYMYFAYR